MKRYPLAKAKGRKLAAGQDKYDDTGYQGDNPQGDQPDRQLPSPFTHFRPRLSLLSDSDTAGQTDNVTYEEASVTHCSTPYDSDSISDDT